MPGGLEVVDDLSLFIPGDCSQRLEFDDYPHVANEIRPVGHRQRRLAIEYRQVLLPDKRNLPQREFVRQCSLIDSLHEAMTQLPMDFQNRPNNRIGLGVSVIGRRPRFRQSSSKISAHRRNLRMNSLLWFHDRVFSRYPMIARNRDFSFRLRQSCGNRNNGAGRTRLTESQVKEIRLLQPARTPRLLPQNRKYRWASGSTLAGSQVRCTPSALTV